MSAVIRRSIVGLAAGLVAACGGDKPNPTEPIDRVSPSCPAINFGPAPSRIDVSPRTPANIQMLGHGVVSARYTAEVAARGTLAYTTSWSNRGGVFGNAIYVWDVSGNTPVLVDTVLVSGPVTTLGDIAVSDDGKLLVVATERAEGSIAVFDLTDPRRPRQVSRFGNSETASGVHTAEIGRVGGKLYAFLAVDPSPSRIVIVDLSDPTAPRQVYSKEVGRPFVHDTFVRSGLLFLALWNDGMEIWDIGGCGAGGSPENPVVLGRVLTVNGQVHNAWWYHDPSGSKSFAFVGEEGAGVIGSSSHGDIHVVDISEPSTPKEVAFYHLDNAGTHNFWVDEANGILYAAYYNGGVRALDIRGDLGACSPAQQLTTAGNVTRCDLKLMNRELGTGLLDLNRQVYVWGVQVLNGSIYASDMLSGIWKLRALTR